MPALEKNGHSLLQHNKPAFCNIIARLDTPYTPPPNRRYGLLRAMD